MKKTQGTTSIGIGTILGVAFIILKLCGVIGWSWLWVLAPFWISGALWLLGGLFAVLYALIK